MAQAQPPPPDRRSALMHLWNMVDYMEDKFFVPTPENGAEMPLAWAFRNLGQSLKKATTSAHTRPPCITYRLTLGDATPNIEYMVVYVFNPLDRSNLQANRDAFKRGLMELVNSPQTSMAEIFADE